MKILNNFPQEVQINASDFVGATSQDDGIHGLVPAPTTQDREKYLKGDGSWAEVDGGGHTIIDENDTEMTQRTNLKFVNADITDDSSNDTTVVTIGSDVGLSVINGQVCQTYETS